jgi:hypothetical protein
MTTALTLITDALIEHGVIGAGDDPQPEDAALCLRKLNQILQRLSTSRLAFPTLTEISVPLTGAESYTVGPTGVITVARPVTVNSVTALDSAGMEYAVKAITRAEWDSIGLKSATGGPPECVWYEATNTNGVIHVYPVSTGYTLKMDCQVLLSSFASVHDQLALPEGYESLLTLMLADDIGPAFGRETSRDLFRRLRTALNGIKVVNAEPVYLSAGMGAADFRIGRGY